MDFKIRQNSELPILEIKPIKNGGFKELLEIIKTATVTFSMFDDKNCFKILNKSAIINLDTNLNKFNSEDNNCNEILDFTIQYHFTKKDTNKIGNYRGQFKIIFEQDGEQKTLITPYDKYLNIEIIKSNTKTINTISEQSILDAILTGIENEYILVGDNFYLKYT